jgi:hypothetical protein
MEALATDALPADGAEWAQSRCSEAYIASINWPPDLPSCDFVPYEALKW